MFRNLVNLPTLIKKIRPITNNCLRNNNIRNNLQGICNKNNIRNIAYYTETHEFIDYDEKMNTAKLGITYYAKKSLGEIIFIDNDFEVGDNVEEEDEVVTIESTKATGILSTPIEGEILQYNDELITDLDTYNNMDEKKEIDFWLVNIQMNKELNTKDLLCEDEYTKYITVLDTD
tara:strand:- start:254 stop:778 length:525 start_codon:yes stop_codon:yes gene_type:complete